MNTIHADATSFLVNFWNLLTHMDSAQIKAVATEHMWLALILCFASGILTSLTPCVYPMIPITINIFGRAAQKSKSGQSNPSAFNSHTFFLSAVYVAGMAFTYSIMGLAAGLTGSLFGKILQSNYMLGFLTLLFLVLAIGQLGVFKLALPASLQTKLSQFGDAESIPGIFLMGLFSGLIVSPCVGPVIAGILAFVFDTSNAFKGFAYFLSFSLGLGVLFLLIGGFSGVLSKLPRSGTWMLRVNRLLALLMFIAAGYYGSILAKQVGILGVKTPPKSGTETAGIRWYTDENEAYAEAKASNSHIFVDFTAVWCEACHVIESTVFTSPKVQSELSKFVNLRIDVSETNDENDKKLSKYGVLSLPTLVFVAPSGKILDKPRVHGVLTPDEFLATLRSITP